MTAIFRKWKATCFKELQRNCGFGTTSSSTPKWHGSREQIKKCSLSAMTLLHGFDKTWGDRQVLCRRHNVHITWNWKRQCTSLVSWWFGGCPWAVGWGRSLAWGVRLPSVWARFLLLNLFLALARFGILSQKNSNFFSKNTTVTTHYEESRGRESQREDSCFYFWVILFKTLSNEMEDVKHPPRHFSEC